MTLPLNEPIGPRPPAVLVHVCTHQHGHRAQRRTEGKLVVAEQELAVDAEDGERLDVLALLDKVERRVGRIEQALRIERLEVDDLEALDAADAELGLEEVHRVGRYSPSAPSDTTTDAQSGR